MSALHERRIAVSEDCAVVGCDDIPIAAHATPPLITVHIPFFETGETAVRLLLRRISGEEVSPRPVLLPVRLVRRVSCGAKENKVRDHSSIGEE